MWVCELLPFKGLNNTGRESVGTKEARKALCEAVGVDVPTPRVDLSGPHRYVVHTLGTIIYLVGYVKFPIVVGSSETHS